MLAVKCSVFLFRFLYRVTAANWEKLLQSEKGRPLWTSSFFLTLKSSLVLYVALSHFCYSVFLAITHIFWAVFRSRGLVALLASIFWWKLWLP